MTIGYWHCKRLQLISHLLEVIYKGTDIGPDRVLKHIFVQCSWVRYGSVRKAKTHAFLFWYFVSMHPAPLCINHVLSQKKKKNLLAFWLLTKSVSRKVNITSRISENSFRENSGAPAAGAVLRAFAGASIVARRASFWRGQRRQHHARRRHTGATRAPRSDRQQK